MESRETKTAGFACFDRVPGRASGLVAAHLVRWPRNWRTRAGREKRLATHSKTIFKTDAVICIGLLFTAMASGCSELPGGLGSPPVVVSVRDSMVDKGKVLRITNTSEQYLHQVEVNVATNSGYGLPEKTAVVAEALPPHRTVEVGWI